VEALRGRRVALVSGGWRHTVAADEAGNIFSWGWNKVRAARAPPPSRPRRPALAPAACHPRACGLPPSRLRHCHSRACGFCLVEGRGCCRAAGSARAPAGAQPAGAGAHARARARAQFGQLGTGDTADSPLPKRVGGLEGGEVAMLACGWRHTLLGLASGDVFSWGRGVNGQLGHNEQRDLCAAPAPPPPPPPPPPRLSAAAPRAVAAPRAARVSAVLAGALACPVRSACTPARAACACAAVNFYAGRGDGAARARLSPRRLDGLSAGGIDLTRLAATAGPSSSYVTPADRYAVVPGGPPSPGAHSGMAVPEMPEPKRLRAQPKP